jgi:hypothetical protein
LTGWLCLRAPDAALRDWHEMPAMRNAEPAARFGDLLCYHGSFFLPRVAASYLNFRALHGIDTAGADQKLIEQWLLKSIVLDPDSAPAAIELGNFALKRGDTAHALHWYALAQKDATDDPVNQQLQLVRTATPGSVVPPLRNPAKE